MFQNNMFTFISFSYYFFYLYKYLFQILVVSENWVIRSLHLIWLKILKVIRIAVWNLLVWKYNYLERSLHSHKGKTALFLLKNADQFSVIAEATVRAKDYSLRLQGFDLRVMPVLIATFSLSLIYNIHGV